MDGHPNNIGEEDLDDAEAGEGEKAIFHVTAIFKFTETEIDHSCILGLLQKRLSADG